jgi:hypothetical protein
VKYSAFLSAVHRLAKAAAERAAAGRGDYLDVYEAAAQLARDYAPLNMTPQTIVNTVLAAGVVYAAPMLIDPSTSTAPVKAEAPRRIRLPEAA